MNPLILVGIAPFSWRLGVVRRKSGKLVLALGPLRCCFHNVAASTLSSHPHTERLPQ